MNEENAILTFAESPEFIKKLYASGYEIVSAPITKSRPGGSKRRIRKVKNTYFWEGRKLSIQDAGLPIPEICPTCEKEHWPEGPAIFTEGLFNAICDKCIKAQVPELFKKLEHARKKKEVKK